VRDEAGHVVWSRSILRDITERKKLQSLFEGQSRVLELVARGASLKEVATKLIEIVEEHAPGMLCSTLLFDPHTNCLRHIAAPSLPLAYTQAIDGLRIGPAVGSCGTAAFRGTRVVVEDTQEDPLWADYRELAGSHGLRACWSQPILSSDQRVLGTFAMYYRKAGGPTPEELELIEKAANLVGVAIERTRAAEAADFALRELDHRVKNTLATVESVAEYTLASSTTLDDFQEAFRGRLRTLARLHMALAQRDFRGLGLRSLVELSVAPWRREENVKIVGDDLDVPSTAVRALGMVLHELATNAAKYGALSVADGHAEVAWRLESMATSSRLRIQWRERNGPRVPIPQRRGFGTMLIEEALTHELGGTTKLEFPGAGVRCEILVPMPQTGKH
jgi:two-component sensor histidine kinase